MSTTEVKAQTPVIKQISRFLKLPTEIRVIIYKNAFMYSKLLYWRGYPSNTLIPAEYYAPTRKKKSDAAALVFACREIRTEATEIFYGLNTFHFLAFQGNLWPPCGCSVWSLMKRLEMEFLEMDESEEDGESRENMGSPEDDYSFMYDKVYECFEILEEFCPSLESLTIRVNGNMYAAPAYGRWEFSRAKLLVLPGF